MQDRDTDKLRDAIIHSLSRDPEMIKIIQEELQKRGKPAPAAPEEDQPAEQEEDAAVRIEDITP